MSKLLRADFTRLMKTKIFWICIAVMAGYAPVLAVCIYEGMKRSGGAAGFDQYFFSACGLTGYIPIAGLLMAAFCSVFIGSDFSDGTIRNKLVSGCSRNAIYLSHLITCAAAGICMLAAYWLPALAAGMPFLGTFRMEGWIVFRMILAGILAIAAYAAVFTMMGMMIQNKTTTAILSLIGVIFVMFTVLFLISRINEPEFIDQVIYDINQIGSPESALTVPNPNYLTPAQRAAAQFVVDLLPTGQSLQIGSAQVRNLWRLPLYALGVIAVTGFSGICVFRKKDLK